MQCIKDAQRECPVCLDLFGDTVKPRLLPCSHNLCTVCAQGCTNGKDILDCPYCRTKHDLSHLKGNASKLPINSLVFDIAKATCRECHQELWTGLCQHCNTHLCDICQKQKTHRVKTISSIKVLAMLSLVIIFGIHMILSTIWNLDSTIARSDRHIANYCATSSQRMWTNGTCETRFEAWGLAISTHTGYIYISDSANHRILIFDESISCTSSWGSHGSGDDELNFPSSIALHDEKLFVSDMMNNRIQALVVKAENVIDYFAIMPNAVLLRHPRALAVDDMGILYICDTVESKDRIVVLTVGGRLIKVLDMAAVGDQLLYLDNIAVSNILSVILVTDFNNNLHVFSLEGEHIKTTTSGDWYESIIDIMLDDGGHLVMAEGKGDIIVRKNDTTLCEVGFPFFATDTKTKTVLGLSIHGELVIANDEVKKLVLN